MENKIKIHTVSLEINLEGKARIMFHGTVNERAEISFSWDRTSNNLIDMIENWEFVYLHMSKLTAMNAEILKDCSYE